MQQLVHTQLLTLRKVLGCASSVTARVPLCSGHAVWSCVSWCPGVFREGGREDGVGGSL